MKRTEAFAILTGVVLSCSAWAGTVQVGSGSYPFGIHQAGTGGEFTLTPLNNSPVWLDLSGYSAATRDEGGIAGSFQTFCLEHSEYIYPYNAQYNITVSSSAKDGGGGAINGADRLSQGTGWLYAQFAQGILQDYDYGNNAARKADATDLQNAFWVLEDERTLAQLGVASSYYLTLAISHFGSIANAKSNGAENFGVYALNMIRTPENSKGQDQLYYQSIPVPDFGATALLLGAGFAGLMVYRHRVISGIKPAQVLCVNDPLDPKR